MSDYEEQEYPLQFSTILDRQELLAGQTESDLTCHVSMKADDYFDPGEDNATTVSICLLFDCSLSMKGKNFQAAIDTAKMIIDIISDRNWISLVAFQSDSLIVFKNAVPTEGAKEDLKGQISRLRYYVGGSTNMAAAIKSGMEVLSESVADANVLVMLSDGIPDSLEEAEQEAELASQMGIQIFAVGMGMSYDATQLMRLAAPSNGAVFGATELDKISDIFRMIIGRVERIFATNVKLDFKLDSSVRLKHVFKTSPERALIDTARVASNGNMTLRVGNIEDDKYYDFILNLEVDADQVGPLLLLRVILEYDVGTLGHFTEEHELFININETKGEYEAGPSNSWLEEAMRGAGIAQLTDVLVQAHSNSDKDQALDVVSQLGDRAKDENNTSLRKQVEIVKNQLEKRGRISEQDLNDLLLASTVTPMKPREPAPAPTVKIKTEPPPPPPPPQPPPEPEIDDTPPPIKEEIIERVNPAPLEQERIRFKEAKIAEAKTGQTVIEDLKVYDLVLMDPGEELIRLLREIRDATGQDLPVISEMIKTRHSIVAKNLESKEAALQLQSRLEATGAEILVQEKWIHTKASLRGPEG